MQKLKDRKLFTWRIAKNMMSILLQALERGGNGMSKKVADPIEREREKFRRMMEKPVPYSNAEEQEKALQELKEKYVKGVVTTSGLIDDTF